MSSQRPTGLPAVGDRSWGTHVCHFYDSERDLASVLVPYFRAGLESNERCIWVASEPFGVEAARAALAEVVEDLEEREANEQIEFRDFHEWYAKQNSIEAEAVLRQWLESAGRAVEDGYDGLRISGDTAWLKREQWDEFVSYEAMVTEAFCDQPILALCSYCMPKCSKKDVMDVFGNHHIALVSRDGEPDGFEKVESPVLRWTAEELSEQRETARIRDRLLGVLGHDLKNPLHVISLAAEELLATDDPAAARLSLRIKSSARRMSRMVEDLLDYARSDLGDGIPIEPSRVCLDDVCRTVLEEVTISHSDRRIELLNEGTVRGRWDPDRLKQALTNLLTNAVEFGEDPVRVRLRVVRGEQWLEVSNGGDPIAEGDISRLFEPFYRSLGARRRSQGLGLGLYIVKEITEGHGGRVEVESDEEETVFRLRLPAAAVLSRIPTTRRLARS